MNTSIVKKSTLLKAVDTFSDETKVKFVEEMKDLLSKIETIVQKEKKKMIKEMVKQLKTQEKTYLDQLAEISKDAKQKLERSL